MKAELSDHIGFHFAAFLCLLFSATAQGAAPANVFEAIREGDEAATRRFVESGTVLESRDAEGNTPLIAAGFYGSAEIVRHLLDRGANVNATNSWGETALLRGSYNFEKARLLTRRGASVNAVSQLGNTPLMLAARVYGNSKTVALLLAAGAEVNRTNALGANALMCAAASDDERSVRLLLSGGADVNQKLDNSQLAVIWGGGRTPLMWAAFRGNVRIAKMLLEAGAKVDTAGGFGTALSQAAWNEQVGTAKLLLERGAPVDQTEPSSGFTPLHWAASSESGRTDLVKLLLAAGANPNAEGGAPVEAFMGVPQTPLLLAKKRGDTAIVRELERAGAKVPKVKVEPSAPVSGHAVEVSIASMRAALGKVVPQLQETAKISRDSFVRHASKQDCMSCHQQNLPMAGVAMARASGVPVAEEVRREQVKLMLQKDMLMLMREPTFHPDPGHSLGYAAFGLDAEKVKSAPNTDEWVNHLAAIQGKDGQWHNNLPRPPIQTSDVSATALAVHALESYPLPARKPEFSARIERARKWLWKLQPANHEERIYQLLGLHWAGERADKLQKLAAALIAEQRADGGWAQLPKLDSDPYATGQALFALHEAAGVSVRQPTFERGIKYLLRQQNEDGTWRSARRAFPFQPTMRSGFPYGRDGWISSAASSWATMALATAISDLEKRTQLSALR